MRIRVPVPWLLWALGATATARGAEAPVRGLAGTPDVIDIGLHQSCDGLANFTGSDDSPLFVYANSFSDWLNGTSYQWTVAAAALLVGLCLTWDGPRMWKLLFTGAVSALAAGAACYEANVQEIGFFSTSILMVQAAGTLGLATLWGFEGSQVLLGACSGFAAAFGMGAWTKPMDAQLPGISICWYIVGAVFGVLVFTTWRRPMLACLAPMLGGLLTASGVGVLVCEAGLRTPFLPRGHESWSTAAAALLGLSGMSSLALYGSSVFVAAAVNEFDDSRRPMAVALLAAPIVLTALAHLACKSSSDSSSCPEWAVPGEGWKWPAAGCLVWAAVTAFTAWVQLDMLEQEMPVGAGHTLEMAEGQSV
eukprot:s4489_g10.t1